MGIKIVSFFHETDCTEEPIDAEIDESFTLEDMLYHFGHEALGLSIRDAIEIDPKRRFTMMLKS